MKSRHDIPILERRFVPKDQIIVKEGDYGQQGYLIQSGEVSVYISKGDKNVELAKLGVGQIVGEMAFIFDGPRTATVKAISDCNLIVISRQQFQEKLKDSDATIRAIVHMLSSRILDANNTLLNRKSSLRDLKEAAHVIYQNVAETMPPNRAQNFKNAVFPSLEAFLESIDVFTDRYDEPQE